MLFRSPRDPGIGFAIGLERVVLLLEADVAAAAPDAYLIPMGEPALHRLLPVAAALRRTGLRVEMGYGGRRLQKELERADRGGAPQAVIVGDEELAAGIAVVRDMRSGDQRRVPLDTLVGALRSNGADRPEEAGS